MMSKALDRLRRRWWALDRRIWAATARRTEEDFALLDASCRRFKEAMRHAVRQGHGLATSAIVDQVAGAFVLATEILQETDYDDDSETS